MKCKQSRPGFELKSACPFPTTLTATPRVSARVNKCFHIFVKLNSATSNWKVTPYFEFLSIRVFGLLSSSLLLFPQRFDRYVLRYDLLQVFVELGNRHGTSSFIESTGGACSDCVSHNRVQVLSIPVLELACCQDWTCNLQMIVSLEA